MVRLPLVFHARRSLEEAGHTLEALLDYALASELLLSGEEILSLRLLFDCGHSGRWFAVPEHLLARLVEHPERVRLGVFNLFST